MSMKTYKYFRDPIHGFIEVDDPFLKIIDSPFFQRLRRIKQLAFTDLVFHGAEHSRFGHSLGTYHLAKTIVERIDQDGSRKGIYDEFYLAALLHDIGHPPFSHAFETVIREVYGYSHEDYTRAVIKHTEIGDFIKEIGLNKDSVVKLIEGKYVEEPQLQHLNTLIGSELDIDRMDFLLRDAYYCGVPYGNYDIERLLLSLQVHNGEIVVQEKGRHAVETFVLSRFYMYTQVYTHHTRRAFDIMLKTIFTKDNFENIDYPRPSEKDVERLPEYDDIWLLGEIKRISQGSGVEADIARSLLERKPIRMVVQRIAYADIESKLTDPIFSRIEALESFKEELARGVGLEPRLIFFDKPWRDLPFEERYRQYSSTREEEAKAIKIMQGDGHIIDVAFDESSLAYHLSRKLAQVIRVYTINEKRIEMADLIEKRCPDLKNAIIRKTV
ncbi:MAG: HD domain-containing protein [Candidatus Brockarchaeota archaeon]|nr:HD domain-containing protein [Candidatus Brockarchaeota archaeon]